MLYQNKTFTQLNNYTDYYICKETTEVLSTKPRMNTKLGTYKILKQVENSKNPSNNYYIVSLVNDLRVKANKSIHRLMAETFLPNPENKAHVNHIDGNKLNNTLTNLEWVTEQENSQHAVDNKLTTFEHCSKEVHQYTLSGKYIQSFISDVEAERATHVAKQNISKVTLGLRDYAGGYQWSRIKVNQLSTSVTKKVVQAIYVNALVFQTTKEAAIYLESTARDVLNYANTNKLFKNCLINYKYFE